MENIKYIFIDYMINYSVKGGIKCPHCENEIDANDLNHIPLLGTSNGLIKNEFYKPPYKCKYCGGRIEQMVC